MGNRACSGTAMLSSQTQLCSLAFDAHMISHRIGSCSTISLKVRPPPAALALSPPPDDSFDPSSRSCCSSFNDKLRPVPVASRSNFMNTDVDVEPREVERFARKSQAAKVYR